MLYAHARLQKQSYDGFVLPMVPLALIQQWAAQAGAQSQRPSERGAELLHPPLRFRNPPRNPNIHHVTQALVTAALVTQALMKMPMRSTKENMGGLAFAIDLIGLLILLALADTLASMSNRSGLPTTFLKGPANPQVCLAFVCAVVYLGSRSHRNLFFYGHMTVLR